MQTYQKIAKRKPRTVRKMKELRKLMIRLNIRTHHNIEIAFNRWKNLQAPVKEIETFKVIEKPVVRINQYGLK